MYSKLYKTIFDGSLYGQFEGLTVFMAMLALADRHGEVDVAPAKIAGCLGCDLEFVLKGISYLEAPDPQSRTPAEEGRRILPLLNDENDSRPFGWKIVNYDKYRAIRNEDERREYKRNWDRKHRTKKRPNPTKSDRARPKTTYTEAEADAYIKHTSNSDELNFSEFWDLYPRKENKKKALSAWRNLPKTKRDKALVDIVTRYKYTEKRFVPLATTYMHGERWEDPPPEKQTQAGSPRNDNEFIKWAESKGIRARAGESMEAFRLRAQREADSELR